MTIAFAIFIYISPAYQYGGFPTYATFQDHAYATLAECEEALAAAIDSKDIRAGTLATCPGDAFAGVAEMKPADIYFICGQGDAATSPGIVALADKYRRLGGAVRVRTEYWHAWYDTIGDVNSRAGEDVLRFAVAYSMGANALTWILGGVETYPGVKVAFDFACFIDPTTLSAITPLSGKHLRKALHYHNNSFDPVGHAGLLVAADFDGANLEVVETYEPHMLLDGDPRVQNRIINEIDVRIGAPDA